MAAMSTAGFTLFDTAIGRCGLAWRGAALAGVQLPEATPAATLARLVERFPAHEQVAPRGRMRELSAAIVASLDGRRRDLGRFELDLTGISEFRRRVYAAARAIPRGETLSYGELARRLGAPRAARAVGQALGANPWPIVVPCHRVLAAGGAAGGFSAAGGVTAKLRMLRIEGAAGDHAHGFEYEPDEAVRVLRAADPALARLIDAVGPPQLELRHTASVFSALARAIVYQQLSGRAAATIFGRVRDIFPGRRLTAHGLLAADESELRAAGLSRNKVLALKDLAGRTVSGELPGLARLRRMDDEAVIEALTAVRGIGRWTVEMMLMFRLGRADVLAVDDLGLRQGHARMLGRDGETDRGALAAYAERWRPYRSVASWYLWRAVELARQA